MDYLILQVEEKQVTAAMFRLSGRSAELAGASLFSLDSHNSLDEALKRIADGASGAARVILCLPPSLFAMRTVTLPFDDLRKVREVLASQLQGELPLPLEELVLDALPAGDGVFLALWARKSEISQAIELCRRAGIEPQTVTSLPFASAFVSGIPADCLLYDGQALMVQKVGRTTFFRAIDSASALSAIPATLAALELAGVSPPSRICLIGTESGVLSEPGCLPLPAELLKAPEGSGLLFKNDQTFLQLAGLYAVAKACQAGALPDFRRGELAWTAGDQKVRRKLLLSGSLLLILLTLLLGSKLLQYRAVSSDLLSLNRSIAGIYREIFPKRGKAVDELAEVRGEIRKMAGAAGTGGYLDLLKKLAEIKGSTINGLYEAELEGRSLRIKGDARSVQGVNEFKAALTPFLASSELGEVKTRPDGMVSFSLTGTVKEDVK